MSSHRRDDQRRKVEKGFCTWCGDELLVTAEGLAWAKDNSRENGGHYLAGEVLACKVGDVWPRVRKWHPWCVKAYMLRNNSGQTRSYVWRRDAGKCAVAGCGQGDDGSIRRHGCWEADHIVPLVDGGSFEMENLQTLCRGHHKEKTRREAGERAARRRAEAGAK